MLEGVLFRGKIHRDFNLLLFPYTIFPYFHFISFTNKNKRKIEWQNSAIV